MPFYWISPTEVRSRTNRKGEKIYFRKDGMPFRLNAEDNGKPGYIPVLNYDDGDCWSDGSIEFRRAVAVEEQS